MVLRFEAKEAAIAPMLTPICRNVSDNPPLQVEQLHKPYHLSTDKRDNVEPVSSDHELFSISPFS